MNAGVPLPSHAESAYDVFLALIARFAPPKSIVLNSATTEQAML
jgi:hypothetical protein